MMIGFRNYSKDKKHILEMNLTTAENILNLSGNDLKHQLCQTKPLTVLATILTSSLELNRIALFQVFNNDMSSNLGFDGQTLMNSLKQYPTLYAAIFDEEDSSGERTVSAVQLLQDNTDIDAKKLFNWRLQDGSSEEIPAQCVPNFSSKDLVEQFGVRVDMSYIYYLKQRRPVYAYIVFILSLPNGPEEREQRLSEACYEACEIATTDFANNPVASACICFLYLLGMDTLALKVDVESANFVLEHWEKRDNELYSSDEKLKKFIVASLKGKEKDRAVFLGMLEECVEAGLRTKNIELSSFAAILSYRIAVQFAQVSNLPPSTKIIEETIKDGCWFHTIVYIQMYQLRPSEIIPALEKSMTNTVLLDHMCAIVKNAKEMRKTVEEAMEPDQRPKQVKKGRNTVKKAALEKDFRAQFYFNLNKRATERTDLVSPTKSASPSLNENRRRREQGLGGVSSGSSESIDEKPVEKPPIKLGEIQPLDDILDIVLECEETGFPSRVLLRYALNYSQPFLTVLAACYKDSCPLNCLSVWLISNIETLRRKTVFRNVPDLMRADWTVQTMLELVSDLLFEEAKAIVVIAQGFKIFMKENLLYHFFLFIESFAAKESDDVCGQHLKAFISRLAKEKVGDEPFIEQFFHQMIPIKVLIAFQSKFFKRKLLQYFIDTDLGKFQSPNRASYIRLAMVCEISKETAILPDYLKLASEVRDLANQEENRIFDHLISKEHLEKAAKLAATLDLPSWKVAYSQETTELIRMKDTGLWLSCEARFDFWMKSNERLHKCRCSHSVAGSFYESQGVIEEDLPFSERALLLAVAHDWFRESKEALGSEKEKSELEAKLKELEKKLWLLKLNAEVEKLDEENIAGPEDPSLARTIQLCNAKIFEFLGEKRNKESFSGFHDSSQTNLLISKELSGNEIEGNSADWSQRENHAFEIMIGQLIDDCEIDQAQRVSVLFGRTTPDLYYILSAIALAQGTKQVENLEEDIKRLLAKTPKRSLSLSSSYDTVVSFNRGVSTVESTASPGLVISDWVIVEEAQNAIEKLMSTCTRGRKCCERILICFKISKMLSITYKEIVSWDPFRVLRLLVYSDMDQQRQICRQYIKTFDLKDEEVAAFIAKIVIRVIKSKANIELNTLTVQEFTDTTKLNPNEITRLMQLVQQPSSLGTFLLEEARGMAATVHGETDLNILETQVELLIRAHDSFTLSCNMEGISEVLRTARVCMLQLVENKAYSLMVRILTGIGRFKEMSYVFEALAEAHHFELLFRKDIDKEAQLKSALLEYIKTNHPNDTEKMDMLSMRFGMHREVGEQLEETGEKQILALSSKFSGSLKDLESELKSVMKTFSYAADNFRKVNCLRQCARCKRVARLAELQIRLLPTGKKVIGLRNESLKKFLTSHEDFYEALIIADGYNLTSTSIWVDPLFERVVQKGEMNYLKQYLSLYQLTGSVVSDIVTRFGSERKTSSMGENLRKMLLHLKDVKLRYKLAHDLSFNDIVNDLLKGPQGAFLKDSLFIH
ncbi:spatacsin-like isoform X1 [Rhopilema esculentum]|uniref:spatacsin-like isoform X1 n=1 Tax=Rhopilema esculentum TaxID=499914 RepID=UPI0031DE0523